MEEGDPEGGPQSGPVLYQLLAEASGRNRGNWLCSCLHLTALGAQNSQTSHPTQPLGSLLGACWEPRSLPLSTLLYSLISISLAGPYPGFWHRSHCWWLLHLMICSVAMPEARRGERAVERFGCGAFGRVRGERSGEEGGWTTRLVTYNHGNVPTKEAGIQNQGVDRPGSLWRSQRGGSVLASPLAAGPRFCALTVLPHPPVSPQLSPPGLLASVPFPPLRRTPTMDFGSQG